MKKIVLTGGGSAGHVTPHLALLPHLLKEGYEVHYIGTQDGIEHGMVGNLPGVTYHVVKSGKLRRYFDWKNFTDPFRVIAGAFQSAAPDAQAQARRVLLQGRLRIRACGCGRMAASCACAVP